MKIYFTASLRGKDKLSVVYSTIVDVLTREGNKVFSDHILKNDSENIFNQSKDELVKVYKKLSTQLKSADILVAEITTPSVSVGHEIAQAMDQGKVVIVLEKEGTKASLLQGASDDKVRIVEYNEANLNERLINAINEAKTKLDVRFNFFVSPKILNYLDWVAQNRKVPRSVFLRDLIEKEMKKDKEYKEEQ